MGRLKIHLRHKWEPTAVWAQMYEMGIVHQFRDEECGCGATRIVDRSDGIVFGYRSGAENRADARKMAKRWSY